MSILISSITPIILIFVVSVSVLFSVLQIKNDVLYACRKEAFSAQRKSSRLINDLIELNPKALSLRMKRKLAEARLAAAILKGNPVAIDIAIEKLESIKSLQVSLDLNQKKIISEAKFILDQSNLNIPQQIRNLLDEKNKSLKFMLNIDSINITQKAAQLAVLADSKNEPAPLYLIDPDYKQKQKIKTEINFRISTARTWVKNFNNSSTQFKYICGANIDYKESLATEKLIYE